MRNLIWVLMQNPISSLFVKWSAWGNTSVDSSRFPWHWSLSWSRIFFLQCWGYCGNGIHCTGGRTTWFCKRNLWIDWSFFLDFRNCRIGILLTCWGSGLDEVPSEDWTTGGFYHVGVGFSAFLSDNCFFPLPRIRILEPYILSWFQWKNWILGSRIRMILAFFLCYQLTLGADSIIHHLGW